MVYDADMANTAHDELLDEAITAYRKANALGRSHRSERDFLIGRAMTMTEAWAIVNGIDVDEAHDIAQERSN